MGKTKILFKMSRNTEGTIRAKMGSIKDRNGMELKEAEDIETMWQEYIENLFLKKIFFLFSSNFYFLIYFNLINFTLQHCIGFAIH